ncbi:MAG: amidohydrolase, partial [Hyphomicrobiales bacterium]|nr:amidohydrolase [Hyphomicrobiales bacterium]
MGPEKAAAFDYLDRNAAQIALLSDTLFWFGEPSLQEYESAKLLADVLEEAGFELERGISGFDTGFLATFGEGGPVIALHAEYDGLPDNSQQPGVLEKSA